MCALTDAEVLQRFPECYRKLLPIESLREILEENAAAAKRNAEEQARKDALKAAKLAALSPAERTLLKLKKYLSLAHGHVTRVKREIERSKTEPWWLSAAANYAAQLAEAEARVTRLDSLASAAEIDTEISTLLRDAANDERPEPSLPEQRAKTPAAPD